MCCVNLWTSTQKVVFLAQKTQTLISIFNTQMFLFSSPNYTLMFIIVQRVCDKLFYEFCDPGLKS